MADRWSELREQVGRLTSCKEDLTAQASQRARLLATRDAALKSTLQADETALTPQRERSRATQLADHIRRRLRRRRKLRKMQFEARLREVSGMPERTGPSPMQRLRQKLHHRQAARRARAGITSTEGALDLSEAIEPEHEPMRLLLQRIDSMSTQPDRGDEQTFPG